MAFKEYGGVEFDEEKFAPEAKVKEKSGVMGFVLRLGIAKNQEQANAIMLVGAAVIGLAAYFLFQTLGGNHANAPELTPADSYKAGNMSEIDNDLRL